MMLLNELHLLNKTIEYTVASISIFYICMTLLQCTTLYTLAHTCAMILFRSSTWKFYRVAIFICKVTNISEKGHTRLYFVGGAKDWKKILLVYFFADKQYLYYIQVVWQSEDSYRTTLTACCSVVLLCKKKTWR